MIVLLVIALVLAGAVLSALGGMLTADDDKLTLGSLVALIGWVLLGAGSALAVSL